MTETQHPSKPINRSERDTKAGYSQHTSPLLVADRLVEQAYCLFGLIASVFDRKQLRSRFLELRGLFYVAFYRFVR